MDCSAASAYVYAKAGGLLAKSFVGQNAAKLFSVKSLRDLYSLLFSGDVPAVPEVLLSKEIESKAEKQFVEQYINLVSNYSNPSEILVSLLKHFEYENLKEIGAALSLGETQIPEIVNIKPFSSLKYKAWPNLQKITENSDFSWYNKIPEIFEQQTLDSKLDSQYIKSIWTAVEKLSGSEKENVAKLIKAEISARNIVWALRLKVYYKMDADEIKSRLAFSNKRAGKCDELAGAALKILNKDVNSFDDWKDWKFKRHLNPHEDGVVWEINPAWVEKSFKVELNKMALQSFHKDPMSILSLVSWFKIKQNELDNIRTVAEGLRLDLESEKLMDAAGYSVAK